MSKEAPCNCSYGQRNHVLQNQFEGFYFSFSNARGVYARGVYILKSFTMLVKFLFTLTYYDFVILDKVLESWL